jgi:hypothetical protein
MVLWELSVSFFRKVGIVAAGFVLASVLVYGELVLDWRTPRSEQSIHFALTAPAGFLIADYNRLQTAMKQKYGERISVSVPVTGFPENRTGIAEISLDGEVLETQSLKRLSDVYGLFVIGPDDPEPIRFPFQLAPDQYLASLNQSLVKKLKDHFKKAPRVWFEFSDTDWTIDRCFSLKSGLGLGIVGDVLRLQEGTSCVVTWKGKRLSSMLVFVGRADGEPWLRPFSESLCHSITKAGLRRLDAEAADSLEYAACILGDQTTNAAARKPTFGAVYAVRPGHRLERLARI